MPDPLEKALREAFERAKCDVPGCNYVPEGLVDFADHLESAHPERGSAKTG